MVVTFTWREHNHAKSRDERSGVVAVVAVGSGGAARWLELLVALVWQLDSGVRAVGNELAHVIREDLNIACR